MHIHTCIHMHTYMHKHTYIKSRLLYNYLFFVFENVFTCKCSAKQKREISMPKRCMFLTQRVKNCFLYDYGIFILDFLRGVKNEYNLFRFEIRELQKKYWFSCHSSLTFCMCAAYMKINNNQYKRERNE